MTMDEDPIKDGINKLMKELEKFIPFNEQEEKDRLTIIKFIETFGDVLTRENIFGHISASAFVLNESFDKTLLVNHNIFGGYVYPGGHADGATDLLGVAIREVKEETSLELKALLGGKIFAIQALPIKGHIKKGEYIPAHIHYDLLYLLVAPNSDMKKIRILETENNAEKWFDLDDSYSSNEAVEWIRPINKKIVTRVRSLKK